MFALHMVHGMKPELFEENVSQKFLVIGNYDQEILYKVGVFQILLDWQEWEGFTGTLVSEMKADGGRGMPSWIDQERQTAVTNLKVGHYIQLMRLYSLQCQ